jgi:VanZ family protein
MMQKLRFLLVAAFILLIIPASSPAYEDNGEAKHFGVSVILGGGSESYLHYKTKLPTLERVAYGTLIGSTPGLLKEIFDGSQSDNHFSGSDMAANVAGALVGSLAANYINNRIQVNVARQSEKTKVFVSYKY